MAYNLTNEEQICLNPIGFTIANVQLTTNSGHNIDIAKLVHDVKIYEALHRAGIIVEMQILDGINLFSSANLAGNEKIMFSISREEPIKGFQFFELEVYVSDIVRFTERTASSVSYSLVCVSKHAYLNNKKLLNTSFNGDTKQLISNIVKSQLKSKIDARASGNAICKGIYPNLKPLDTISWLLRNANDKGTPLYFYETAAEGLILTSYKEILNGEVYNNYNKNPEFEQTRFRSKEELMFEEERNKIRKIKSALNLSKLTPVENGVYGSILTTIDISTKETEVYKFKFEDEPPEPTLNKFPAAVPEMTVDEEKLFDMRESKKYYQSLNENAFELSNYHKQTDNKGMMQSITASSTINNTSIDMIIAGDFNFAPGKIVELEVLKHADITEELVSGDEYIDQMLSGKYLVTKTIHHFAKDGYVIHATLKKDSFKEYQLDLLGKI